MPRWPDQVKIDTVSLGLPAGGQTAMTPAIRCTRGRNTMSIRLSALRDVEWWSRHPLLTTGASSPKRHRGGGHGHTWLGSYGRRFDAIGSSGRPPAYPERDAVFRWCRGGRTERRRSRRCLTVCGEDELGEVASGRSSSIPRVGGASRAWRWRWRPRRDWGWAPSTARLNGR
jgi:hypothetical protein